MDEKVPAAIILEPSDSGSENMVRFISDAFGFEAEEIWQRTNTAELTRTFSHLVSDRGDTITLIVTLEPVDSKEQARLKRLFPLADFFVFQGEP
jgi:hypothetical protein